MSSSSDDDTVEAIQDKASSIIENNQPSKDYDYPDANDCLFKTTVSTEKSYTVYRNGILKTKRTTSSVFTPYRY